MHQQIEVPAAWPSLATLLTFSDAVEAGAPLSAEQSYLLRLVIEEIATNIIKYGYADDVQGPIQVSCHYADGTLTITMRDRGCPYDPRAHPEPDLDVEAADRSPGGLGLYFVCAMADALTYHHDPVSGWNELIVTKVSS